VGSVCAPFGVANPPLNPKQRGARARTPVSYRVRFARIHARARSRDAVTS